MNNHTPRLKILLAATITLSVSLGSLSSCKSGNTSNDNTIIVSIAPVKYLVETITGGDFDIEVLVPDGVNPETYSPTPSQLAKIEKARMIYTTGLIDFEQELVKKITNSRPEDKVIVDLSTGIDILHGTCSHGNAHHHGVDPHIWTSPEALKVMTENAYRSTDYLSNDAADIARYYDSYNGLVKQLDEASETIRTKIAQSSRKYFLIYHPALTYYARDYGIEQVALENDGKEPSAVHMRQIIELARGNEVKVVLYQRQFARSTVETLAADIGAEAIEIDPLSENILQEILRITDIITR